MSAKVEASVAAALFTIGVIGSSADLAAGTDPLAACRWTSRVLVLAAPEAGDGRLQAQREALASAKQGFAARALVVVEAVGSDEAALRLRRKLALPDAAFRAVLIGKDGGAKLSSSEPIPPQRLFATIDAMPMRQSEMRARKDRR